MSDLDFGGAGGDGKVDAELQEFLLIEKQKAQVNAQVSSLFEIVNFKLFYFRL